MNPETLLLAFGSSLVTVFAAGGVLWRLWTKKLQAEQAHELSMKQLDLQVPPYLGELDAKISALSGDLSELRARLEKAEKTAAAFGDNFDVAQAQGNLTKLERTMRDRKAKTPTPKK